MKRLFFTLLSLGILFACSAPQSNNETTNAAEASTSLFGEFANADFQRRSEGYDYLAIRIDSLNEYFALVNITARADKKDPSCELQVIARIDGDILAFESVDKNTVHIISTSNGIKIETAEESNGSDLYFYCTGGATIAGEYQRTSFESVPPKELTFPELKTEVHSLQGIDFKVQHTSNFMFNQVLVSPSGLELSNRPEVWPIEGQVERTEIEDLNSDGWPEVLSFIRSTEGKVSAVGYSVNSGQSMSMIYLPELSTDEAAMYDYNDKEEVRIVENTVIRRFPIYENGQETQKYRQLQYKLVNGEAARVFKLDKVTEY